MSVNDVPCRGRRARSMGEPTYAPEPGSVPPPGETLQEWLANNHHTQVWLAGRLGTSPKHVNRIIKGRAAYTAELALRLAEATGLSARFWMHLQADYQVNNAMIQERDAHDTPAARLRRKPAPNRDAETP